MATNVVELIQRTERLERQAKLRRRELDELRHDLLTLGTDANGSHTSPDASADCFTVAAALAQNLGPEFSSQRPSAEKTPFPLPAFPSPARVE